MIKPVIYESDYYLLIVAGKYGTICEDTGLSYTKMEYDFAVKNHKRVIAFVNDDSDNLPLGDREVTEKMRRKLKSWIHEDENDIYTPIGNYIALKEWLQIDIKDNVELYYNNMEKSVLQLKKEATGL